MENIRRYFKRTDKTYLLLCIFSSVMAVTALSSWAAKQGNGFAVDEITGQITGLGDYRRAAVQAGAALIGLVIAVLLSNIDYRSLVKVWPVHVALTWGMVLPTLVLRNVSIGPLTIGYNAGDTDNYSWYKLGGFTLQPTELAKISFILTFAMHLNNVRTRLNEPKELGKLLLHLAVPILIIHVQGDDGTAIIGAIAGAAAMAVFSVPSNYFITYPAYVTFYHMPLEAILGMYQAILPSADSLIKCLVIFNMPFTLVKGLLDAALCLLIYKPLSPILHGRK